MNYKYTYESPLGTMIMLGTLSYLTDLFFIDEDYAPSYDDAEYIEQLTGPFEVTIMWLDQYFNGKKPFITPPIQLEGTEFRKSVWSILQTIPYGETTTYGDIGKEIAKQQGKDRMSAQAVGGAVGHNPISIIIPCHRVIGSNGKLTGYAGGIERKKYMLDLEAKHKQYILDCKIIFKQTYRKRRKRLLMMDRHIIGNLFWYIQVIYLCRKLFKLIF